MRTSVILAASDALATAGMLLIAMWFREVLAPAWFGVDPFLPAASYLTLWPVVALVVAVLLAEERLVLTGAWPQTPRPRAPGGGHSPQGNGLPAAPATAAPDPAPDATDLRPGRRRFPPPAGSSPGR